jgi:hypothetical protein
MPKGGYSLPMACEVCGHRYLVEHPKDHYVTEADRACPECVKVKAKVGADVFEWLERAIRAKVEEHEERYEHTRSGCGCC